MMLILVDCWVLVGIELGVFRLALSVAITLALGLFYVVLID